MTERNVPGLFYVSKPNECVIIIIKFVYKDSTLIIIVSSTVDRNFKPLITRRFHVALWFEENGPLLVLVAAQ